MPNTAIQALPYPDTSDVAGAGPAAFEALAEAAETKVVMTFTSAADRSSKVTSPTTGMLSHLADTDLFEGHDGAAWETYLPCLAARKTGDETVTSNATPQNDDHLSLPVQANRAYVMELWLMYDTGTTPDLALKFTAPTGSALEWTPGGPDSTASSVVSTYNYERRTLTDPARIGGAGAGTRMIVRPSGLLTTAGTAGTFQVQWSQWTSDASNTIVRAGSFLRLMRVP